MPNTFLQEEIVQPMNPTPTFDFTSRFNAPRGTIGQRLRFGLAALALVAAWPSHAIEFAGRGVHRFESKAGCPMGADPAGAPIACNRLALDDDFVRAEVSPAQSAIMFTNTSGAPTKKRLAGDVLLHGQAKAANGQTVPISLHVKLESHDGRWSTSAHAHAPVEGKLSELRIDPYTISVREGDKTSVVFTAQQGVKLLIDPSLGARIADDLIQVHDNLGAKPSAANVRAADITVGIGTASIHKPLVRARFDIKGDLSRQALPDTLLRGNWTLQLEALSGQIPADVIRRDLFLTQLEREPMLRPLGEKGWPKGSKIAMGVRDNRGFLRVDGQEVEYEGAARSASAFLQDTFAGLILLSQITRP